MKKILLIAVLVTAAAAAACGEKKADRKDTPSATSAAAPSGSPQLLALLPAKNEVAGWAVSRAARSFTADTLYELIDGAADGFVTYGVQEVVTADYTQAGTGYQAVIEIYQMKDALNAYGKYSEERHPEYQFLQVGSEGYSGGTSVNFWIGQYYVKTTTFEDKEPVKQALVALAQAVAGKVKAPGAEPVEVSWFPKENQIAHSTLYIPKDVLAQSYFTNGFEARYKVGDKEHKLMLIVLDSPAAAQDGMKRYRDAVSKGGKDVKTLAAPGEGGFSGTDSFYGNLVAVRAGKYIAVALGAPSADAGRKQVGELVRNVK
jgi:hypothetical protein